MTANDIINQLYANGNGMTIPYVTLNNNILSFINTSNASIAIDNNNIYITSNAVANSSGYFYNGVNILYVAPGANTLIGTLWAPCNVATLYTLPASVGDRGTANNGNSQFTETILGTIVQPFSGTHGGGFTGNNLPVYFDGTNWLVC